MNFPVSSKGSTVFPDELITTVSARFCCLLVSISSSDQEALSVWVAEDSSQAHQQRESAFLCLIHKTWSSSANSTQNCHMEK